MAVRFAFACLFVGLLGVCGTAAPEESSPSQSNDPAKGQRAADDLVMRCSQMLDVQLAIRDEIDRLHKVIEETPDKKPRPQDAETLQKLVEKQKQNIGTVTKVIEGLEAEGSTVAFPEAFKQLRKDMINVQNRLKSADVGAVTQNIEEDIIANLKDMIEDKKK